jgi:hypothetical protein
VPLAPSMETSVILSPQIASAVFTDTSRQEANFGRQNRKEIVLTPALSTAVVTETSE